ncbi:conserved exported hypothetical protein [Verrucomicrobia bacterium]|nr:conserved exported hypothetical protein [Verrucomicrobiota bacterium]
MINKLRRPHPLCQSLKGWSSLGFLALLCGCAATRPAANARHFDFRQDTFAYPNELVWEYHYDDQGKWISTRREPPPGYSLHCFVLARSAWQFFENARFDPQQPVGDETSYRRLIRRVMASSPRRILPEERKIVIPGYAGLRAFSAAQEPLLKAECGGAWQSYVQWSHWRMIFPFTRGEQQRVAKRLRSRVQKEGAVVVHLVRFPQLTINHGMLLYDCHETEKGLEFTAYDPNRPDQPAALLFDRENRTFLLAANDYFPGGRVDVYEVYAAR